MAPQCLDGPNSSSQQGIDDVLDVFAAVTSGRHVHCTLEFVHAWFKLKIDAENG